MSRSFLAALRSVIFSTPEIAASIEEQPVPIAATLPPPVAQAQSMPPTPIAIATHPSSVQDMQGRFATIAKASGIAGSAKRLTAALQLAAEAPEMSAEDIVAWTLAHIPVADVPARKTPSLEQRAAEAQRFADTLGTSTENTENGWGAAIDEAHRRHKIN